MYICDFREAYAINKKQLEILSPPRRSVNASKQAHDYLIMGIK